MFEFAVASHGVSCLTPLGVLQDRDWAQRWTEWKDLPSAKFERLWTSLDIFGLFQRRHTWNYMGHPKDILKCKNRDIFMSAHCHVLKCVLHSSELIMAGIADPISKSSISNENKQFDLVRLVWLKICCPPRQRAEGSCSGRVLYSGHSAGTTPATHTHTYTWVAHTDAKEYKEDQRR